jgi:hypothetical protein
MAGVQYVLSSVFDAALHGLNPFENPRFVKDARSGIHRGTASLRVFRLSENPFVKTLGLNRLSLCQRLRDRF